ncbi:MAG: selenocysteine-specific translation elongation factor [Sphaerochaetaceae bacterium]
MYIVGTAGHVDHGKSTLVKALTGVDPDRLPEEKKRLLTIELGFAHFITSHNEVVGIIDVPGHERFMRNMVSGTWSLDSALLLVAADDGWMEQTEDHALVLKGMAISSIIVVITKSDLVDDERLKQLHSQIQSSYARIFNSSALIVETSALKQQGIDELKQRLEEDLSLITRTESSPRLFVDRVFSASGTGTVVTGSLQGGAFSVAQHLIVLPSFTAVKIRSLQSFGKSTTTALGGQRVAIALQGISHEKLVKGDCLVSLDHAHKVSKEIVLRITSPYEDEPLRLKNHSKVEVASGTWHSFATVKHLTWIKEHKELIGIALLKEDHPFLFNDPLLFIQPGSSHIIAFARIVLHTPIKREEASLLHHSEDCSSFDHISLLINGYAQLDHNTQTSFQLAQRSFRLLGNYTIEEVLYTDLQKQILENLSSSSLSLESVKNSSSYPSQLIGSIIDLLISEKKVVLHNNLLSLSTQDPVLSDKALSLLETIDQKKDRGYETKFLTKEEKGLVSELLKKQAVVIVEGIRLYSHSHITTMCKRLLSHRAIDSTFSIAEAKEDLPLSRKYLLPLLNYMEKEGYLLRVEERRKVKKVPK